MSSSKKVVMDLPETKCITSNMAKWIPLICAGAAFGVSIIALKEIKNVRKELINFKHPTVDSGLNKRIQTMDDQLTKITEYLKNNQSNGIIKKVPLPKKQVTIINEPGPEIVSDEFEEVEVTDSESED
jgi:hypothetical protein